MSYVIINLILHSYKKVFNQGKPDAIHIELSRNLCLGQQSVENIIKKQSENQKKNDELKHDLINCLHLLPTKDNILKLALYKELKGGKCIYSNKDLPISASAFKVEWHDWEVDHILPYSRSFD